MALVGYQFPCLCSQPPTMHPGSCELPDTNSVTFFLCRFLMLPCTRRTTSGCVAERPGHLAVWPPPALHLAPYSPEPAPRPQTRPAPGSHSFQTALVCHLIPSQCRRWVGQTFNIPRYLWWNSDVGLGSAQALQMLRKNLGLSAGTKSRTPGQPSYPHAAESACWALLGTQSHSVPPPLRSCKHFSHSLCL